MAEQEIISSKCAVIKEEYEIKINDNKLKIEINNDEIIFILVMGISYYKYIKRFKYNEIVNELNIFQYKDIKKVYDYLLKSEYKIIKDDKKIIINNNQEIKLYEKKLTNEEMIKILIDEIKEIKDKNNKQNNKINELIEINEDKEKKINILENEYNKLNEKINQLEDKKKDKDEINLIYTTEDEGIYNIFGQNFVQKNKNTVLYHANQTILA